MSIGDRQAFPNPAPPEWSDGQIPDCEEGMTYRQLLIAAALNGLLSSDVDSDLPRREVSNDAIVIADETIALLDAEVAS